MSAPKILILSGSTRIGSHNVKLAALAAKERRSRRCRRYPLADYPLPLYDADDDTPGAANPTMRANSSR